MSKSKMAFANRAWRKATRNWGFTNRKKYRFFCREIAATTVANVEAYVSDSQVDWDHEVAEELNHWGD